MTANQQQANALLHCPTGPADIQSFTALSWLLKHGYAEFIALSNKFVLTTEGFNWLRRENAAIEPIPTVDDPCFFNKLDLEQAQKILNQHHMPKSQYIDNDLFMKFQAQVYESLNGLQQAVKTLDERCQELRHEMRKHTIGQHLAEDAPPPVKQSLGPFEFHKVKIPESPKLRAALSKVFNCLEENRLVYLTYDQSKRGMIRYLIDDLVQLQGEHYRCWCEPLETVEPSESNLMVMILAINVPGQVATLNAEDLLNVE